MPMTYRIDSDASLLFVKGMGVITQPERITALLAWIKDPAYKPSLDAFCDFCDTNSTPTLSELRELIAIVQEHAVEIGPTKVAILTSKPITFGIARVFEALADAEATPLQVKVFFERQAAWNWLRPDQAERD